MEVDHCENRAAAVAFEQELAWRPACHVLLDEPNWEQVWHS